MQEHICVQCKTSWACGSLGTPEAAEDTTVKQHNDKTMLMNKTVTCTRHKTLIWIQSKVNHVGLGPGFSSKCYNKNLLCNLCTALCVNQGFETLSQMCKHKDLIVQVEMHKLMCV